MTIRIIALVLAVLLAAPALALLLRPGRGDGPRTRWLSLDGLWTVTPVALAVALVALAAAA